MRGGSTCRCGPSILQRPAGEDRWRDRPGQGRQLQVIASLAAEIREASATRRARSARLAEAETFTASSLEAMASLRARAVA